MMRTEERVSISAFVDPDEYERLVERARLEDRSVSAVLRQLIRKHVGKPAPSHDNETNEESR